jgi:hypothetical protein
MKMKSKTEIDLIFEELEKEDISIERVEFLLNLLDKDLSNIMSGVSEDSHTKH